MLPIFFNPNYDDETCKNIEICSLTMVNDDATCGANTLPEHVLLKKDSSNAKWIEASRQVLEGYSYSLCIKCVVHAKLTVETIFEIEQISGCSSYLVPLEAKDKQFEIKYDHDEKVTKILTV